MKITITVSDKDARVWKYFLGLEYGTRKGLKKLIMCAIYDKVAKIALKESENFEK